MERERSGDREAGAAHEDRDSARRAPDERLDDAKRERSGSTPTEEVVERALDVEPGVEWHAGEDAGEVPDPE
jgi:hypothetical protein